MYLNFSVGLKCVRMSKIESLWNLSPLKIVVSRGAGCVCHGEAFWWGCCFSLHFGGACDQETVGHFQIHHLILTACPRLRLHTYNTAVNIAYMTNKIK